MPNTTLSQRLQFGTNQITFFLCPVEGCDIRFKSTYGRTQHICAKHPNFGIITGTDSDNLNEPGEPRSDDMNRSHRPIDSSPYPHTTGSQLDQFDERMSIDSELDESDDFLQPPMAYAGPFSSPPPFDNLLPFPASQSPAIHSHDGFARGSDADDIESTASGHSQATCAFTDYHLILNGKFIHSISNALY